MEIVVDASPVAQNIDRRPQSLRHAEQHECLVQTVRSEIVGHAHTAVDPLFPSSFHHKITITLEIGFEFDDPAQAAGVPDLLYRTEIAVKTTVLVDGQQTVAFPGQCSQLFGFFHGKNERLFDHDMFIGKQGHPAIVIVRDIRRIDDDQFHLPDRDQLFERSRANHIGIALADEVLRTLSDRHQIETRVEVQKGCMEYLAGKAERSDCCFNRFHSCAGFDR